MYVYDVILLSHYACVCLYPQPAVSLFGCYRQLVWGDAWLHRINVLNVEDRLLRSIDVTASTESRPIYGLVLHRDVAYFSVWALGKVLQVDLSSEEVTETTTDLSTDVLFSMALKRAEAKPGIAMHTYMYMVFIAPFHSYECAALYSDNTHAAFRHRIVRVRVSGNRPCALQLSAVCDELCLPTGGATHVCACADYGGRLLHGQRHCRGTLL